MNLKYILGSIISIPLLPLLFFQGKKIRQETPQLPEAKKPEGFINANSEKTLNIIAIGESTIAGVGVEFHKNGFIGSLAYTLSKELKANINWRVYAKSGFTVKQVSKKIIPKIEDTEVDIIVIGVGGNDAFTLNSPKNWVANIEELITLTQEKFPNTPIYFANMPPIKEFPAFTKPIKFVIGNLVEIFGERLKIITNKKENVYNNAEIVTLKTWSEKHSLPNDNPRIYFSDGVHPSELTYQVWGKEMGDFILKSDNFNLQSHKI